MFAVTMWDTEARRGVLIRDRLGIKPLYYAIVGDRVRLGCRAASASWQAAWSPRARPRGNIPAYLMLGYVPAVAPAARRAQAAAGERLIVENGQVKLSAGRTTILPVPNTF